MNLREWARRRLGTEPARTVDALAAGADAATGLPAHWNHSVRSFYHFLEDPAAVRRCIGTACTFARERDAASPAPAAHTVRCLGRCYEAPAETSTPADPPLRSVIGCDPVVLRHLMSDMPLPAWSEYALPPADEILDIVDGSGLRGRGGAAYPTGAKWKVARDTAAPDRCVVANGDEGDPGAFIDRLLLEDAPHSVLAGMLACATAIGATRGVVYVRGEYPLAARRVEEAVAEADARGLLGALRVRVVRGAGSYVAGEETALLRSIEGFRAEPAPKPPYPAVSGLDGLPTVVQNVETLSVLPWILANRRRADTKAFCLSGAVRRTGVVEAPLGVRLRTLLEDGAGGARDARRWKMALVGGPLGRVVAERDFDVELSFERLPGLGHGGIVVFDESTSVRDLVEHLFEFARAESCGTCTPCRVGTSRLASRRTRPALEELLQTLEEGSLCGFGQGVPRPIRDLLDAFGDEVLA